MINSTSYFSSSIDAQSHQDHRQKIIISYEKVKKAMLKKKNEAFDMTILI